MAARPAADLPELLERLRAEVREARVSAILEEAGAWAARQPPAVDAPTPGFPTAWPMDLALDDITRWHDAEFVRACYEGLLRRAPDAAGFALYLNQVRAGTSRIEIAVGFAGSPEARQAGVHVRGLARAAWMLRLARVPLVGYLLRVAKWILRGPRYLRDLQAAEANLHAQLALAREATHRLRLEVSYVHERQARNLSARLARLADQARGPTASDLAALGERLDGLTAVTSARGQAHEARLAALDAALGAALARAREEAHEARVAALDATLASARETGAAEATREAKREARLAGNELRMAAQDAQMQAIREAGMAELAQATASLETRLSEILTRESALLEARVGERLQALEDVERDIEALRAALATLRGPGT
jgi:Domain of unknown function (DUF4214)